MSPLPSRRSGLSLIELIATLAVVATLAATGVPALTTLVRRKLVADTATAIRDAMRLAREEARARGTAIMVCPGPVRVTCQGDASWGDGWFVVENPKRNTDVTLPALAIGQAPRAGIRILGNRTLLRFAANGRAEGANQTVVVCHPKQPSSAIAIIVARTGRIRQVPATREQAGKCA
jgi:prepilin-type N-terminal cleavage/methylation domain-containing protein